MKQFTDQELLEIYSAYLPYGVNFLVKRRKYFIEPLIGIKYNKPIIVGLKIDADYTYIGSKLLLRPLSDLTKEIEHEGERFVPIVELFKIRTQKTPNEVFDYYIENDTAILRVKCPQLEELTFKSFFEIELEPYNIAFSLVSEIWEGEQLKDESIYQCGNEMKMLFKLLSWHFDIFGAIENGIAVDLNTVEK